MSRFIGLLKETFQEFGEDKAPRLGAALAGSAYGAAGSLVILLIWVYWSAQILFLPAEFTQVYARSYGSMRGDSSKRAKSR